MPAHTLLLGNNQNFRNHCKSWYFHKVCKASCTLQIWTNWTQITCSPFSCWCAENACFRLHAAFHIKGHEGFPQTTNTHLRGEDFEDKLQNWQQHEVRSLYFRRHS